MVELAAIVILIAAWAVGVWCAIRIERHRRERETNAILGRWVTGPT